MRTTFKWVGLVLAGMLLLGLVLFGVARLMGPSPADRAALDQMGERQMPAGRNGFAALWLLPWDVPQAAQETIAREDDARFRPEDMWPEEGDPPQMKVFNSAAAESYADLRINDPQATLYCPSRSDCLQRVEADREGYARLLQRDERLLDRIDAVAGYDHLTNPFAPGFGHNMPAWNLLSRINTRRAHDFVRGELDVALAGTCRDASMARMLLRDADGFMPSMVGLGLLEGRIQLFAEMLSRLPAGHPLPAVCAQAFALPASAEFGLCRLMGGEWRYSSTVLPRLDERESWRQGRNRLVAALTYNREKFDAEQARFMQQSCGEEAMATLAAEQPLPMPQPIERDARQWFGCLDNLGGCSGQVIAANIAAPAYRDFAWRHQDARARLRLLNALLWLRANRDPSKTLLQQVASLPEAISAGSRGIRVGAGGATLEIDLYSSKPSPTWSLPLSLERAAASVDGT